MSVASVERDIQELDRCLGLKPAIGFEAFAALHRRQEYSQLCRAIGAQLGLNNDVRLNSAPSSSERQHFTTTALSRTDASGRGTHGIVAQVDIPSNLPMYGTVAFGSYVIDIRLRADFRATPARTLVALLAHELSHVLLHALRHQQRDSEQFTDLVPLITGFGDIVEQGRVVLSTAHRGSQVVTSTVTYGYLSNDEFVAARRLVRQRLSQRSQRHATLVLIGNRLKQRADTHAASLLEVRSALANLDESRTPVPRRFARRVVELHTPGLLEEQERVVSQISRTAQRATQFSAALVHYSAAQLEKLSAFEIECANAGRRLAEIEDRLQLDRQAVALDSNFRGRLRTFSDRTLRRLWRLASRNSPAVV